MLMTFASEHLHNLTSARRLAVHSTRLNPIARAGTRFDGHLFTSFDSIKPLRPESAIGNQREAAAAIYRFGRLSVGAAFAVRPARNRLAVEGTQVNASPLPLAGAHESRGRAQSRVARHNGGLDIVMQDVVRSLGPIESLLGVSLTAAASEFVTITARPALARALSWT